MLRPSSPPRRLVRDNGTLGAGRQAGQRPPDGEEWSISARWVFPILSEPVPLGRLTGRDGTVTDVGPTSGSVDLPDAALIPLTVNLHTHLELSSVTIPLGAGLSLPEWIPHVIAHRRERGESGVPVGMQELEETGSSLAVDIVQDATVRAAKSEASTAPGQSGATPSILRCQECLGLSADRWGEALEALRLSVDADPQLGLSPHAPYSVAGQLLDAVVELATSKRRLVTMHVAETPDERELLEHARGPLATMLKKLGAWNVNEFGDRQLAQIVERLAAAPRAIIAHGNDLRPTEWQALSGNNRAAVAYCPRTHAFFRHARHPVSEMLADGVNVGLGTDSRASNPDLSIWNEMRFLWSTRPDVSPPTLLQLGTINGARALGRDDRHGHVGPGAEFNALVVPLAQPDATEPYAALFGTRR